MTNIIHLLDCMKGMKQYPDKWFDLAVCDPNYGIGMDGTNNWSGSKHKKKQWDNTPPSKKYFIELQRISKNIIIWGANHFIENIPKANSSCWIVWDKKNDGFSFADAELAYSTFNTAVRFFRYHRGQQTDQRIHPTQKPIALYDWIFKNYAQPGMKILDTHVGSMSSVISAIKYGCTIHAYETDADYFAAGKQRVEDYFKQGNLFSDKPEIIFSNSQTETPH